MNETIKAAITIIAWIIAIIAIVIINHKPSANGDKLTGLVILCVIAVVITISINLWLI